MRECNDATVGSVTVYLAWVGGGGDDCLRRRARRLAIDGAAAALGRPVTHVALRNEPSGRPVLEVAGRAAPDLHVGISHAWLARGGRSRIQGVVAVALSGLGPVGVDVEVIRDLPALALARRWLTRAETSWLERQSGNYQTAAFLLLWTRKEAVGKALGVGLRGSGLRRALALPGGEHGLAFLPDQTGGVADAPTVWLQSANAPQSMAVGAWLHGDLVLAVACATEPAVTVPVTIRWVGQEGIVER